jgi:hypothetical protein
MTAPLYSGRLTPALDLLRGVAEALGPLVERVVFIGGATAPLHQTHPVSPRVRPTKDVDGVAITSTYSEFDSLQEQLRAPFFMARPEKTVPADSPLRSHQFLLVNTAGLPDLGQIELLRPAEMSSAASEFAPDRCRHTWAGSSTATRTTRSVASAVLVSRSPPVIFLLRTYRGVAPIGCLREQRRFDVTHEVFIDDGRGAVTIPIFEVVAPVEPLIRL